MKTKVSGNVLALHNACTVEETRYGIARIKLEKNRAIATDGRMLALVECEPTDQGYIKREDAKELHGKKSNRRRGAEVEVEVNLDGDFPKYQKTLEDALAQPIQCRVGLDAALLLRLAKALSARNGELDEENKNFIFLEIPVDSLKPIVVTPQFPESTNAIGVIMPAASRVFSAPISDDWKQEKVNAESMRAWAKDSKGD